MENSIRQNEHKKIEEVEALLAKLSNLISDDQPNILDERHPIIFIMGCARSGTTVLTQYLSQFDAFCYPTNFISRFYFAPYAGSMLQKLMFDLDAKNELFGFLKAKQNFTSNLGKTTGPLAPNEFWYYWRRFFKFGEIQKLTSEQLSNSAGDSFVNGLRCVQSVFNKPLFLKGMIMNWNIPFLAKIIRNSYFIVVKRDIIYNAQSLYLSRERYFGDVNKWYSFKPEEISDLKNLDPLEQVIAQVHYTNKAIDNGIQEIPADRRIEIVYEDFCRDPNQLMEMIKKQCSVQSENLEVNFENSNRVILDSKKWQLLNDFGEKYR